MAVTETDLKGRYLLDDWQQAQKTYALTSPIDGRFIADVADCGPSEASAAARVAAEANESWRNATAYQRAQVLERWHDLMLEHRDRLARTMTLEMGKPITESRGEVSYAAGFVKWYAEEAKRVYSEGVPSQFAHKRLLAIRQPVGPAFAITPWNFPAAMVTRKAAPALAAGCPFILKPAEQTPITALEMAALWQEAGGPAGTLQVLPTAEPGPLANALIDDPRIRKISFTGSTEVGKVLYGRAAATVKRISFELGGHAPFLIFADADIDRAVEQAVACKYRNAGQTCVCTNRIYVDSSIAEEVTAALVEASSRLSVGDPFDEATDIGPLVNQEGLDKVEDHVRDAVAKGATVALGGRTVRDLYYAPTVLTGVTREMRLMHEETFGPVAPVIPFDSDEEAIRLANDTPYGLAAYLYTHDLTRAFKVGEALEYGIVGVNDGVPSTPQAPFGGVKASGVGREGGKWGIDEYLEVKYLSLALRR